MSKKKPKPNPIEEAIGSRAKTIEPHPPVEKLPQVSEQILDEPSPSEMLTLENLNRRTEERLSDNPEELLRETYPEILNPTGPESKIKETTPVSKPDPQPVTKTSSQESPPQGIDTVLESEPSERAKGVAPTVSSVRELIDKNPELFKPAEDIELTALRKYILEDGFVLATVAFHIVSLCAEPLTTPSTTTWDFKDRAMVPDMVLALLNQPGYIEGIWPSLRIIMGSNKGNAAWSAGIATTIAFFDIIRTLPMLKELQNDS